MIDHFGRKLLPGLAVVVFAVALCQPCYPQATSASPSETELLVDNLDVDVLGVLQGRWKVSWTNRVFKDDMGDKATNFWKAMNKDSVLEFHNGRLRTKPGKHKGSALLVSSINGTNFDKFLKQKPSDKATVLIGYGGGDAGLLGVSMNKGKLRLAYPAGCCSRSGLVLYLQRIKTTKKTASSIGEP